jgi:hypothetical protein
VTILYLIANGVKQSSLLYVVVATAAIIIIIIIIGKTVLLEP